MKKVGETRVTEINAKRQSNWRKKEKSREATASKPISFFGSIDITVNNF